MSAPGGNVVFDICSVLAGYAWDEKNPFVAQPRRRLDKLAQWCAQ